MGLLNYVADLTFLVPGLDIDVPGLAYDVQGFASRYRVWDSNLNPRILQPRNFKFTTHERKTKNKNHRVGDQLTKIVDFKLFNTETHSRQWDKRVLNEPMHFRQWFNTLIPRSRTFSIVAYTVFVWSRLSAPVELYHSRQNGRDRQYECDRGIKEWTTETVFKSSHSPANKFQIYDTGAKDQE